MTVATVLDALAEAAEAGAAVLRRRAALLRPGEPGEESAGTVLERARQIHPLLGFRQEQVLGELEEAGTEGTTTGAIRRALDYDQANTHIVLGALVDRGLVEKDTSVYPHIYRLSPPLLGGVDDGSKPDD